jgi:hypothetical protein
MELEGQARSGLAASLRFSGGNGTEAFLSALRVSIAVARDYISLFFPLCRFLTLGSSVSETLIK